MNCHDYLQYLKKLIGDDGPGEWAEENTAGLFQRFRPDGKGVEQVFAPIPDGRRYLERLLPVYRATGGPECANDMYFIVRSAPPPEPQVLEAHAMAFARNLRALAEVIGNEELRHVTGGLRRVAHEDLPQEAFGTDEHLVVYEVVGDWLIEKTGFADQMSALREAYYIIACNHWLANYLQWPCFERFCAVDVFAPYFELWRRGVTCSFRGDTVLVGRRT